MSQNIVVEVKEIAPVTVAYNAAKGDFGKIPAAFGALYGWMGAKGIAPAGMPSGVYYDDPRQVPVEDCRWELRSPVAPGTAEAPVDSQGLGIKQVPGYQVASTMYKGPYAAMAPTYEALAAWVIANGYAFAGPPEEVYFSDPATTPPAEYLTEIRFPVMKG
jgi:effector-binding domain-containing protein